MQATFGPLDRAFGVGRFDRVELVQEPRGLLVLTRDRAHVQLVTGPGAGYVEQPPLFSQLRCERVTGHVGQIGNDVDQLFGAKQRPATAHIGPAPFLHRGDAHDVPLQAFAGVRREDLDGVAGRATARERLQRKLLGGDVFVQRERARLRQSVGQSGRGVEQVENGVEIAVGGRAGRAPGSALAFPDRSQTGSRPDGPEHVFGLAAGLPLVASTVEHGGDLGQGAAQTRRQHGQRGRVPQHRHEEFAVLGLSGGHGETSQLTT